MIQSVQVVTIYWGWNFANAQFTNLANNLDGYFGYLTGNNSWMNGLAQSGGVGTGNFVKTDRTAPNAPAAGAVVDASAQVVPMINGEIMNKGVPAPGANTLYVVFTPPGVSDVVTSPFNGATLISTSSTAAKNLQCLGFHTYSVGAAGQPSFAYAVMAFPDASIGAANYLNGAAPKSVSLSAFNVQNDLTIVASHELAEAVTDPIIYASPTGGYFANGWYYNPNLATTSGGSEIGDLTVGQNFILDGRYWVQRYWSNFIALSTYPHALPLLGGNASLPGVTNSPLDGGEVVTTMLQPSPPGPTPTRPNQPAPPSLANTTSPSPPTHTGPSIPGGASLVQPSIVASSYNPSDLAVASQNGLQYLDQRRCLLERDDPVPDRFQRPVERHLRQDRKTVLVLPQLDDWRHHDRDAQPEYGGRHGRAPSALTHRPRGPPTSSNSSWVTTPRANLRATTSTKFGPSSVPRAARRSCWRHHPTRERPGQLLPSSRRHRPPAAISYGATVTAAPSGAIDVAYHLQPGYTTTANGGIVPNGTTGQTLAAIYAYNSSTQVLTQQGSTLTAFGARPERHHLQQPARHRTIAGTTFLTQGSVIPYILVNPTEQNVLYVVTAEDQSAGTNNPPSSEVVIATLTQSSTGSWSVATSTVAAPSSTSTFQLFPTAAIDQQGDIVVSWYSNQGGQKNAAGHYLLDTYATYSTDGGTTWATPFKLDATSFDPDAGAAHVLGGTPATTGIGNSFGVAIEGATVFVAHDGNTTSGSTPTGQQVAVDSFVMPGVLTIPANPGNNVITLSRMSPSSDIDVVQLNGVTIFSGPVSSIAGGIVVEHDTPLDAGLADVIPDPNVGNDTLILNYANGDPVPAGGITDNATAGGNNTIQANANASYVLSDSSLTITGTPREPTRLC